MTPVNPLESALTKTAGCHPHFLPPIPILEPIPSPIIPVFHGMGDITPIALSPSVATLFDLPASVANKRLTVWLSPLDATLTKNTGVGVSVMVNQESNKNHCPKRPPGARIDLSEPCRATNHESRITSLLVAPLPSECYDLVFHDPC